MKVINPTDLKLEVVIRGSKYVLEGNEELKNVPEEHAVHWKTRLHTFVILEEESKEQLEKKELVDEEVKEEEIEMMEVNLDELGKSQLDEVAKQLKLEPKDYQNKGELIEAIMKQE